MTLNQIGKFQARKIVQEFDDTLIALYGVNMSDAGISRFDALSAYEETQCARKAAELCGNRKGLALVGARPHD